MLESQEDSNVTWRLQMAGEAISRLLSHSDNLSLSLSLLSYSVSLSHTLAQALFNSQSLEYGLPNGPHRFY